jgi:hypothetical protein
MICIEMLHGYQVQWKCKARRIESLQSNSSEFTQAQLDEVQAELSKAMSGGLTSCSAVSLRELWGRWAHRRLTRSQCCDNATRAYEDLNVLD